MSRNLVKHPPRWSQYRKLNDKAQRALEEAIKQAIKDSSEDAVTIFLMKYIGEGKE